LDDPLTGAAGRSVPLKRVNVKCNVLDFLAEVKKVEEGREGKEGKEERRNRRIAVVSVFLPFSKVIQP